MKTNRLKTAVLSISLAALFSAAQGFPGNEPAKYAEAKETGLSYELSSKSAGLGFWIDSVVVNAPAKTAKFVKSEIKPKLVSAKSISRYVKENLTHPEQVLIQNVEGAVVVQFSVGEDGTVDSTKIISDISEDCRTIVERVVRQMRFSPALQNGYPVSCTVRIPIEFNLYN